MASAKVCPCATAAKGLRPATPKIFYLSLEFIGVSSSDELQCLRTSLRKGWLWF